MNILVLVITVLLIVGLGGGGFYILWIRTRPKKQIWQADIYTLGAGIKEPPKDKEGKILSNIELKDLKPYASDYIEKVETKDGKTYFKFQKLDRIAPEINDEEVENWGRDIKGRPIKRVKVLLSGGTPTLLKTGYDKISGEMVFQPLSVSQINLMKGEIAHRKNRLHKETDILQAITPWITMGIMILGLVGLTYILVSGYIEMSENMGEATKYLGDKIDEAIHVSKGLPAADVPVQVPKKKPPLIEGG